MDNIAAIIGYIIGAVTAVIAGWQTLRAELNKQKAKDKEKAVKKVGDKMDIITPLLVSMVAVERQLDGYEKHCGRCGRDPLMYSPAAREEEKLNRTLELTKKWCKDNDANFDYAFLYGKYNEFQFILRGILGNLPEAAADHKKIEELQKQVQELTQTYQGK